jgi:hypothetical protein
MTRLHNTITLDVPEIDEGVMRIETNDGGGHPVLLFEPADADYLLVFNWGTGRYEPPVEVITQWPT